MESQNKTTLPHELLCRIQNLFPDMCHLCKETYCVKLHDKPILTCAKCGQGCHSKCVLQLIGKTEEDLNEGNEFGAVIVNPFAALGLLYLCSPCQENLLPQKENVLIKIQIKRPHELQTNRKQVWKLLQMGIHGI